MPPLERRLAELDSATCGQLVELLGIHPCERDRVGTAVGDGTEQHGRGYPEDTELRDSFRLFAEGGELADAYADEGCASARSPKCANLIVENLDAWATWYESNG